MIVHSERIFQFLLYLCLVQADVDELYLLKRLDSDDLYCVYHSPEGNVAGLAWVLPTGTYNPSYRLKSMAAVSTKINGPIHFSPAFWQPAAHIANANVSLPAFLDDSWNDLIQIDTMGHQYGDYKKLLNSAVMYNELHVSILAKRSGIILLEIPDKKPIGILFDPFITVTSSAQKRRGNTFVIIGEQAKTYYRHAGEEREILNNGLRWMHFTIHLKLSQTGLIESLQIINATNGQSLMDRIKSINVQSIGFIMPFVNSQANPPSPASYRAHDDYVILHRGIKDETKMMLNLTSTLANSSCVNIRYFFREGFGEAFVFTKANIYRLEPTNKTWKQLVIRFDQGGNVMQELIFKLPIVDVEKHGYVFAIHRIFSNCMEGSVSTYIDTKYRGRGSCQSISFDKEQVITFQRKISTAPNNDCPTSKFGKSCNLACTLFSNKTACENLIVCNKTSCMCFPGYYYDNNRNACVKDPNSAPTSAKRNRNNAKRMGDFFDSLSEDTEACDCFPGYYCDEDNACVKKPDSAPTTVHLSTSDTERKENDLELLSEGLKACDCLPGYYCDIVHKTCVKELDSPATVQSNKNDEERKEDELEASSVKLKACDCDPGYYCDCSPGYYCDPDLKVCVVEPDSEPTPVQPITYDAEPEEDTLDSSIEHINACDCFPGYYCDPDLKVCVVEPDLDPSPVDPITYDAEQEEDKLDSSIEHINACDCSPGYYCDPDLKVCVVEPDLDRKFTSERPITYDAEQEEDKLDSLIEHTNACDCYPGYYCDVDHKTCVKVPDSTSTSAQPDTNDVYHKKDKLQSLHEDIKALRIELVEKSSSHGWHAIIVFGAFTVVFLLAAAFWTRPDLTPPVMYTPVAIPDNGEYSFEEVTALVDM